MYVGPYICIHWQHLYLCTCAYGSFSWSPADCRWPQPIYHINYSKCEPLCPAGLRRLLPVHTHANEWGEMTTHRVWSAIFFRRHHNNKNHTRHGENSSINVSMHNNRLPVRVIKYINACWVYVVVARLFWFAGCRPIYWTCCRFCTSFVQC